MRERERELITQSDTIISNSFPRLQQTNIFGFLCPCALQIQVRVGAY